MLYCDFEDHSQNYHSKYYKKISISTRTEAYIEYIRFKKVVKSILLKR